MFIIQTIYKHLSDGEWELLIVQVHLLTFPQQRDLGGERTLYLNIYCHSAGTSPWKKRFGGGGRVEVCSGLQFMPTSFPPLRRFFLNKTEKLVPWFSSTVTVLCFCMRRIVPVCQSYTEGSDRCLTVYSWGRKGVRDVQWHWCYTMAAEREWLWGTGRVPLW